MMPSHDAMDTHAIAEGLMLHSMIILHVTAVIVTDPQGITALLSSRVLGLQVRCMRADVMFTKHYRQCENGMEMGMSQGAADNDGVKIRVGQNGVGAGMEV
jgi:hypothetical protein